MANLDYLSAVARESARFHEVMAAADPGAPVVSCPGWTAADLLFHLTEVQQFWGTIVRERLQDVEEREAQRPDVDYAGLLAGFLAASAALQEALSETADEVAVWTWAADHSVGFIRRRQAHEALIHRLDAELITGEISPLEPDLAADGVDEALTVMYGGYPPWAHFDPVDGFGRVLCSDTGRSCDLILGTFSGTSPNTGKVYDRRPAIDVTSVPLAGRPSFDVTGTAGEVDAWLWKRNVFAAPTMTGDPALLAAFRAVIDEGIQ
jgi:uncharacterized protein (TIGR03083 family)